MSDSYTDGGMSTVDLIPVKDLVIGEVGPIGAGLGTRGTRDPFSGKFSNLVMVNMLLTKKCNFRCDYCVEDKDLPDENMWTARKLDNLVRWIKDQDLPAGRKVTLSLFGGEPLLEWDTVKDLITYGLINYRGIIDFNISTNIVLLDSFKQNWLEKNCGDGDITFLLSLDGFERVKSRHTTGNKNENLMHIIRKNLAIMKEFYPRLIKNSSFRVSLLPQYIDIIEEDLFDMLTYGTENIIVHPVTTELSASWTPEKYKRLEGIINRLCVAAIESGNTRIECMEGVSKKDHNCGAGNSMLAANADGNMYSCYFTAHANMSDDIVANFILSLFDKDNADIYLQNPNYDLKCASCNKKHCFQCSVKNLLQEGQHFCSSSWCEELADLYENTLEMCELTMINSQITKTGLTMEDVHTELSCGLNDMVGLLGAALSDSPYVPEGWHCGCEDHVYGGAVDMVKLIRDFSTLKLGLEALHNGIFPDNKVSSL